IRAEDVARQFRRERGQFVEFSGGEVRVRPEPYEQRLVRPLLLWRKNLAEALVLTGAPDAHRRSVELYESILALLPRAREDPSVVCPLAVAYAQLRRYDRAAAVFRDALRLELPGRTRVEAYSFLIRLALAEGRTLEAGEWRMKALADRALDGESRRTF